MLFPETETKPLKATGDLSKLMKRGAAVKTQKKSPKKNSTKSSDTKNKAKNNSNTSQKSSTAKKTVSKRNHDAVDPERLELSKTEIIEFCDRVLKKWQQDPAQNARNIPAMIAVRTSVFFSDEVSLKAIWSEIISWVYQLLYHNAQAQARKEGQEWAQVFSKIKNED